MGIRILRARDLVRTPWKNGGGTTVEIVVEPPEAGLDDFDWRISMADVRVPGPFSTFAGIDRTLALLEGASIELDVDGMIHRLDAASPALSFPGEAVTSARLPTGPIRDLNVMTRRSRFRHRMRFPTAHANLSPATGSLLGIVALAEGCSVAIGSQYVPLDRLDVLVADSVSGAIVANHSVIAIEITAG